jgi:hypothetical protein
VTTFEDQFDLDIRLSVAPPERPPRGVAVVRAQTEETDTCDLGCQTQTCPSETCGCSTLETCDQHLEECGFPFTFGAYCEDQTDDTCGCQPGGTADCAEPPDSLGCPPEN